MANPTAIYGELAMHRGDTKTWNVTVTDEAGAAINLTSAEVWFTAKRSRRDPDSAAIFQKTVGSGITLTSPTLGQCSVTLTNANTSSLDISDEFVDLFYDLQILTSGGNLATASYGILRVYHDITLDT